MGDFLQHFARENLYKREDMDWGQQKCHTWSSQSELEYLMVGLVLQTFIRERTVQHQILRSGQNTSFPIDESRTVPVMTTGIITFWHDNQLYTYDATDEHGTNTHTLTSPQDVNRLARELDELICSVNPLRGKYLKVSMEGDDLKITIGTAPEVNASEIVLPRGLTFEELELEIIGPLSDSRRCRHESVGALLYGEPGLGKSLTLRYLARRALEEGHTVIEIATRVDYLRLQTFSRYLGSTLWLLEDIDSNVGESRTSGIPSRMSDFLQTLSGITRDRHPMSIVASTNHIDLLDDAIRNRPGRFNRKWEFVLPDEEQIHDLVDVYFGEGVLSRRQRAHIAQFRMTGDLVRELFRTCSNYARQSGCPLEECFDRALETVAKHFTLERAETGFAAGRR